MPVREIPTGITAEQALLLAQEQAFAAQQQALRQQLVSVLLGVWAGVAAAQVFDPAAAAKFVSAILPVSLGAQRTMAAATVAQFNAQLRPPEPIALVLDAFTGEPLRQRDPREYYERPFKEIRRRLAEGKTVGQALDAGRRRAQSIAETDLRLAHTRSAQAYIAAYETARQRRGRETLARLRRQQAQNEGRGANQGGLSRPADPPAALPTIVGYRRVLSNNPNHCALCVLASTQRYKRENLMPIHPGCSCTVRPVLETEPNADRRVLEPDIVGSVDDIIRNTLGDKWVDPGGRRGVAKYRDIILTTHEHGELGPVLGVRGHHFQGPPDGSKTNLDHERINPFEDETVFE